MPDIRSEVTYFSDTPQATAHASGIEVVRDDVEASILRLELEDGRVEYVVFNRSRQELDVDGAAVTQPFAYRAGNEGETE